MVRYRGPKNSIIKALGSLPGLKFFKNPSEVRNQNISTFEQRSKKTSEYGLRLKEKQKLRYNYGISEPQLFKYVKQIRSLPLRTQHDLVQLIEMRLDNIVYRLGFTFTIASARQLINHGKILVNFKSVNIASFICKKKDIISLTVQRKQKELIEVAILNNSIPKHLVKLNNFTGQIKKYYIRKFPCQITESLIRDFYGQR